MTIKYLGQQMVYPKPVPFPVPMYMTSDGLGWNSREKAELHEATLPK